MAKLKFENIKPRPELSGFGGSREDGINRSTTLYDT